jgi:DNA-binding transcriptional regulator YiaG
MTMGVQFIRSPAGEELAVLPRAEYEALVEAAGHDEDEADAALFAERVAELAGGAAQKLPAAVSAAMLRGDSLLTALRKAQNLTQTEVATRTGLSQGYLSDLESGRRHGSEEVLAQLASCYDVPPAWLTGP